MNINSFSWFHHWRDSNFYQNFRNSFQSNADNSDRRIKLTDNSDGDGMKDTISLVHVKSIKSNQSESDFPAI